MENDIAADQIFPIIVTNRLYTPTIKHHCCRTALASTLRACSNKVWYDEKAYEKYRFWFKHQFIPKFLDHVAEEIWNIDMETWLSKFPIKYREAMRKAIDVNEISTLGLLNLLYKAFTKVEMQFTTVPHEYKETELNDTKERQICGPADEKKVWANAFINILEEIASKYMSEYCGRANWLDICKSLDKADVELGPHIWGASDGSGFDMTQYPKMNELMNDLLIACANHPNMVWHEPLSIDRFIESIAGSLLLKVSMDDGDLKYEAVGRASGDGWTTFGNTMLMISYWKYTFHLAGISKYLLKVKGDDVLFAVPSEDVERLKLGVCQVFTNRKDQHVHGLGQICKKIDYGDITELDFLSNEFFRTKNGTLRMTRIPARVLQTNCWSTKLPHCKSESKMLRYRQQLCFAKGKCLKAWADGLPIFGVLADKMIELGVEGKLTDFNQYADGDRVWHQGRDDYDAYLVYLEERYGVTKSEVLEAEKKIKALTTLSGRIDIPAFEKFYSRFLDPMFH